MAAGHSLYESGLMRRGTFYSRCEVEEVQNDVVEIKLNELEAGPDVSDTGFDRANEATLETKVEAVTQQVNELGEVGCDDGLARSRWLSLL